MTTARERCHFLEQLSRALAGVFVLNAQWLATLAGQRFLDVANKLAAGFVHADEWMLGIVCTGA